MPLSTNGECYWPRHGFFSSAFCVGRVASTTLFPQAQRQKYNLWHKQPCQRAARGGGCSTHPWGHAGFGPTARPSGLVNADHALRHRHGTDHVKLHGEHNGYAFFAGDTKAGIQCCLAWGTTQRRDSVSVRRRSRQTVTGSASPYNTHHQGSESAAYLSRQGQFNAELTNERGFQYRECGEQEARGKSGRVNVCASLPRTRVGRGRSPSPPQADSAAWRQLVGMFRH
jgi:hypothetical protein